MKNINPNIFPKDGYKFRDRDGSWHHADTWAGVIKRVRIYRQRAGFPMGEPEREVIEQACERHPDLCHENTGVYQEKVKLTSLKSKVLNWLNALIRQKASAPISFVSFDEVRKRTEICAGCPKNSTIPEGCSSCRAALKALREQVIGDRPVDSRLMSCTEIGCDLPTAVYLDEVRIDHPALPGNCWRKRTL